MTGTAVFDAAHLSDAVTKASKVAPTKGAAFDKAAGLLFELDGVECVVSSTNLDLTYRQVIPIQDYDSEEQMRWRISSTLIVAVAQSLKMDSGQGVTFIDRGDRQLRLSQGSFKAKFPMLDANHFPPIPDFPTDGMADGTEFSTKAAQITWACKTDPGHILSGVHIDGEYLYATDSYTLVAVPCDVPVPDGGITVPLRDITSVLRSATDVRLRASDDRLLMMLDSETKATSTIMTNQYPKIRNAMRTDTIWTASFARQEFCDTVAQMMTVVASEKSPVLTMTFDPIDDGITLDIISEYGQVQQHIHAEHDVRGEPQVCTISPSIITPGVSNSRANNVKLTFGKEGLPNNRATMILSDGSDYEAHMMPIVPEARSEQP